MLLRVNTNLGGVSMDEKRAKEIVNSPVMAHVTYGGAAVYMESVNEAKHTCTIHYLNDESRKIEVPVKALVEH